MRRQVFVMLALLLGLAAAASASFFDFEQLTVDNTSGGVTFTASKITPASSPPMTYADCRLRTAEVSYLTVDPKVTAVTSSVGQLLEPGDRLIFLKREDMLNFRAIRTGATSGQLDCYYKNLP